VVFVGNLLPKWGQCQYFLSRLFCRLLRLPANIRKNIFHWSDRQCVGIWLISFVPPPWDHGLSITWYADMSGHFWSSTVWPEDTYLWPGSVVKVIIYRQGGPEGLKMKPIIAIAATAETDTITRYPNFCKGMVVQTWSTGREMVNGRNHAKLPKYNNFCYD